MLGMYSLSCLLLIDIVNLISQGRPGPAPPVPRRGHAPERGAELCHATHHLQIIMRGLDPRIPFAPTKRMAGSSPAVMVLTA